MDTRALAVESRISAACKRAGRNRKDVTVVAVSKYSSVEETQWFLDNGYVHLGENRLQSAEPKLAAYPDAVWHFIGHLQTRKVRDVVSRFTYIHSVDSAQLASELVKRQEQVNRRPGCFLQVNISGEESKGGFSIESVKEFVKNDPLFRQLRVVGLMTMTPKGASSEESRSIYRKLRELRDELRSACSDASELVHLSMGMSQDFESAIEEGATFVRLGSVFLT